MYGVLRRARHWTGRKRVPASSAPLAPRRPVCVYAMYVTAHLYAATPAQQPTTLCGHSTYLLLPSFYQPLCGRTSCASPPPSVCMWPPLIYVLHDQCVAAHHVMPPRQPRRVALVVACSAWYTASLTLPLGCSLVYSKQLCEPKKSCGINHSLFLAGRCQARSLPSLL
jgi:hypothetical protein